MAEQYWMVISGGVRIPAPLGVYRALDRGAGAILVLVCYGDLMQTKAIGARLATHAEVSLAGPDGERIQLVRPTAMRMRGAGLFGGVHRLVVWDETAPEETALWLDETGRPAAVKRAIDARRIPYDPAWLAEIEVWMREREMLIPLAGWGGAGGYDLAIDEDRVCDWLIARFGRRKPPCPAVPAGACRPQAEPAGLIRR